MSDVLVFGPTYREAFLAWDWKYREEGVSRRRVYPSSEVERRLQGSRGAKVVVVNVERWPARAYDVLSRLTRLYEAEVEFCETDELMGVERARTTHRSRTEDLTFCGVPLAELPEGSLAGTLLAATCTTCRLVEHITTGR